MKERKAVIILDMVLLVMSGSWVLFNVAQGIGLIEIIYNYIYFAMVTVALGLNIKLLRK